MQSATPMQTHLLPPLALFLSLASLVACSSGCSAPKSIDLGDYDRTCAVDADCVLATGGDVCRVCACPDGAINVKDQDAYAADRAAEQNLCGPLPAIACGACIQQKAACQGGMCVVLEEK